MFIFGKKGKPLNSVAAILKKPAQKQLWTDWFGNLEAYTKIRESYVDF